MHWFRREFLQLAAQRLRTEAVYHVAKKQIPTLEGSVPVRGPGLKPLSKQPTPRGIYPLGDFG